MVKIVENQFVNFFLIKTDFYGSIDIFGKLFCGRYRELVNDLGIHHILARLKIAVSAVVCNNFETFLV